MAQTTPKIIHIARLSLPNREVGYLLLKQVNPHLFTWFEKKGEGDMETAISDFSIEKALKAARTHWKWQAAFRTVICGFRYTLPERDEHGINALFYQMVASYSSPNGIYFDEEAGHNCIVHFASQEALSIWHSLKELV